MIQFPVTPSEQLVLPSEDRVAFNQLRAGLHAEHCAATPTELFLVEEVVQNTWRIRRFRVMETAALEIPAPEIRTLALIERCLTAAERACHRALTALTKLQKDRGFVPQKADQKPERERRVSSKAGFVPQKTAPSIAEELGLDPIEFERMRSIREKVHAHAANSLASFRENRHRPEPSSESET